MAPVSVPRDGMVATARYVSKNLGSLCFLAPHFNPFIKFHRHPPPPPTNKAHEGHCSGNPILGAFSGSVCVCGWVTNEHAIQSFVANPLMDE